jgi:hypothetical protein
LSGFIFTQHINSAQGFDKNKVLQHRNYRKHFQRTLTVFSRCRFCPAVFAKIGAKHAYARAQRRSKALHNRYTTDSLRGRHTHEGGLRRCPSEPSHLVLFVSFFYFGEGLIEEKLRSGRAEAGPLPENGLELTLGTVVTVEAAANTAAIVAQTSAGAIAAGLVTVALQHIGAGGAFNCGMVDTENTGQRRFHISHRGQVYEDLHREQSGPRLPRSHTHPTCFVASQGVVYVRLASAASCFCVKQTPASEHLLGQMERSQAIPS